ncbi:M1 family metallopeptidase [Chitinimonas lacunae]|uniref:Aminopeptidase n=1 Tax=Chitinimonas lacunae TaxID=1963018 RepID=A0ABV8MNN3_9NEIS
MSAIPLLLAAALGSGAAAEPMRLPAVVKPLAYQVDLKVDPAAATHRGEVAISLATSAPARTLLLHGRGLRVSQAVLERDGASWPATVRQRGVDKLELRFQRSVPAGEAVLKLTFSGTIAEREVYGLFRQKEGGDWYAFTQFESTGARRAFPSFDEPGWKVPWTLSLTVPEGLTAVANTPASEEKSLGNGWKTVRFQRTKPLPSYLVAFGVGPFEVVDGGKLRNIPIRYVVPKGRGSEVRYAVSMAPRIVERLEQYFDAPYPYEKLDSLVIPLTVGFSAMENAGLITYTSGLMLAKPAEETEPFKRRQVDIMAHELAHQWFGNYVTMAWWDDLWLNEAFASWMGSKITDQLMPEWKWSSDTQEARARAMAADRLASTRRIHQPVENEHDLNSAFDSITYQKGQAVLSMFETWLGEARFREGVRSYMKKHAWGNATGADFVAALSSQDPDLAPAFRSFIEQPGIPRLKVELKCDDSKARLLLEQSRFLPQGSTARADQRWQVPVTVRVPGGMARLMLKQQRDELVLPLATGERCPAWVQANHGGTGYYRPVYAPGELVRLMTSVPLSVNEILAGLDDAQALTESADLPLADALKLAGHFASHPDKDVVGATLAVIRQARFHVAAADRPAFAAFVQRLYGERTRKLGLLPKAGESSDDALLRADLAWVVADSGQDAALRAEAGRLARSWLLERGAVDPAVREAVLSIAALEGDRTLFERYAKIAAETDNRKERRDLFTALGNFREPALAEAARRLTLDAAYDAREATRLFRAQNEDDATREGTFKFLRSHFASLAKRLPEDSPGYFPRYLDLFCSEAQARALERWLKPTIARYDGGPLELEQSLEQIRLCSVFRSKQAASLSAFLGEVKGTAGVAAAR